MVSRLGCWLPPPATPAKMRASAKPHPRLPCTLPLMPSLCRVCFSNLHSPGTDPSIMNVLPVWGKVGDVREAAVTNACNVVVPGDHTPTASPVSQDFLSLSGQWVWQTLPKADTLFCPPLLYVFLIFKATVIRLCHEMLPNQTFPPSHALASPGQTLTGGSAGSWQVTPGASLEDARSSPHLPLLPMLNHAEMNSGAHVVWG